MTEDKRYRVYKRGNYYAIDDDIGQVAVISCIRTEIEAEWLCNLLNNLTEENRKPESYGEMYSKVNKYQTQKNAE